MLCQAQLSDQSLFFPLLLSFFSPKQAREEPTEQQRSHNCICLIKPQISSSKCLPRTDATGSCSLLPVPLPINLMAEPASAAGASLAAKGALGAAAWRIPGVSGGWEVVVTPPSPLERMWSPYSELRIEIPAGRTWLGLGLEFQISRSVLGHGRCPEDP